jgi:hypothetical protein
MAPPHAVSRQSRLVEQGPPMRISNLRLVLCLLALPLLLLQPASAARSSSKALEDAMAQDGLRKISVKGIELAYAKPGATLANYKRVRIDPVEVAFHPSWDPTRTGSHIKVSSTERQKILDGVAKLVQEEFAREIQGNSGYALTEEAGDDVLRVKISIVNLYVTAPDTGSSTGRSRTYVVSAGEMTLFAELFDSRSGEVIARVVDRQEARSTGRVSLSGSVPNQGEARSIAAAWARILRKALDNAHGIAAK